MGVGAGGGVGVGTGAGAGPGFGGEMLGGAGGAVGWGCASALAETTTAPTKIRTVGNTEFLIGFLILL